jgi:hypothetical protein
MTMTELNPDTPPNPITVPATPTSDQVGTLSRDFLLIVGVLPALLAVLGTRDVTKIVAFLSSSAFAPVLGLVLTAGVVGFRQWKARRTHAESVKMANASPNSVAVVK